MHETLKFYVMKRFALSDKLTDNNVLIKNGVFCWFCAIFQNDRRSVAVRYDTVRYGAVRYGTLRHGTLRYGTVRYATIRYATIGTVRYGTLTLENSDKNGLATVKFPSVGQSILFNG
jgi:hypothetical protein